MEIYQWLDLGLKQPGRRGSDLAKRLGLTPDKISKMRRGLRQPKAKELAVIEAYLGERAPIAAASIDSESPTEARTVRLVGYVGAGAEAYFLEGELDEVPAPEGSTPSTVAVEVRGTSLGALFDRWLIFYDDIRSPVTSDLYGRLCVVRLEDGRTLVKKIKRLGDGAFSLISNTEDPIEPVRLKWAAKVKAMVPR